MIKNKINSVSDSLANILKICRENYPEACALTDSYIQALLDMNRKILSGNLKTPELITSGILVAGMGTLFYTTAPSTFFPPFYSIAKNISEFVLFSWLFTASVIVFFAVEITKIFITSDTLKQLNINNDLTSFLTLWEEIESNKQIPAEATRKVQTKITLLNLENACKYQKHIQIVFWFARFCTIIQGLTIALAAFSAGWIEEAHKQYPHCFRMSRPATLAKLKNASPRSGYGNSHFRSSNRKPTLHTIKSFSIAKKTIVSIIHGPRFLFMNYLLLVLLLFVPVLAHAAPQNVILSAGNTTSRLHAKTLFTPVDGTFEKVVGDLSYDPETQVCHVDLRMEVSSLRVGSALLRTAMLSGLMLDSDDHPSMRFAGDCQPKITNNKLETLLVGKLTMRGQTHPLTFKVRMHFSRNTLTEISSSATFDQRQWGMSTMLGTVQPLVQAETSIMLK